MGESIVYAIKCTLIAVATATWVLAVTSLCGSVVAFVGSAGANSVLGNIIGIISMCVPFQARTVFGSILTSATACIGFVIARKVYTIVMKSNEAN